MRILSSIALRFLLAILAIGFIAGAYNEGVRQKLDGRINYGFLNDLWSMSVAITAGYYDVHLGYVGQPEVFDAIIKHMAPDGFGGHRPEYAANAQNPQKIEEALKAATSLDPKTFRPYTQPFTGPFVMNFNEDSGVVDFYQLSFWLFGHHATSMYRTYFVLFLSATLLYLWQFRRSLPALAALATVNGCFLTLFYLPTFSSGMPSVNSNRFMESLGIIPTLHMLIVMGQSLLFRHRPNRSLIIVAALQCLIMTFALSVRASAQWQWLLIGLWIFMAAGWLLWRQRGAWKSRWLATWRHMRYAVLLMALLLGINATYNAVRTSMYDPIYSGDCVIPYHFKWHSAFIGLSLHRDWHKIRPEAAAAADGDTIAFNVAKEAFYRKWPDKNFLCPAYGGQAARIHEKLLKEEYLKFVFAHPVYVLELHLLGKPAILITDVKQQLSKLPSWWYVVPMAMMLLGLAFAPLQRGAASESAMISLFFATMLVMSTAPAMFAYPIYNYGPVWLVLCCGLFLPLTIGALAGRAIWKTPNS